MQTVKLFCWRSEIRPVLSEKTGIKTDSSLLYNAIGIGIVSDSINNGLITRAYRIEESNISDYEIPARTLAIAWNEFFDSVSDGDEFILIEVDW